MNLGNPKLTISEEEMVFEAAGGEQTLKLTATRDWTVETDADWVVVDPEFGAASAEEQTVTVTVLENTGMDRSADLKFTIGMHSRSLTVTQAGPGGSAEALVVYSNDFDISKAQNNSGWPYLDSNYDLWDNKKGTGSESVTYAFGGKMSVRTSGKLSNDGSGFSHYAGSGMNKVFFGAATSIFKIQNITLDAAKTDYALSFGGQRYTQDDASNIFSFEEFKVYLSNDAEKWVPVTMAFPADADLDGDWNLASAKITLPKGTEKLSIAFVCTKSSAYSIDDVLLELASEAGQAIDFSNGEEISGTTGGGGSVTPPSNIIDVTIAEFNAKPVSTTDWYRLTGTVSGPINTQYGNYDLNDATGKVYVYGTSNWADYSSKFAEGATVTIVGQRGDYNGKIEVLESYIESLVPGEGGSTGDNGGNQGGSTDKYYVYKEAQTIESGKSYIMAVGSKIATMISGDYGYIQVEDATVENGDIIAKADNAFVFTAVDGGYTIKQSDDRYLFMKGTYNSFNLAADAAAGHVWTVAFEDGEAIITNVEMNKSIQFDSNYNSYGAYPDVRGTYPTLYVQTTETDAPSGGNNGGGNTGGSGEYEPQNVSWTLGEKAYDNTSGNNAQTGTVNGVAVSNMLKLGTGKLVGDATLHVAAGTAKLGFYCIAWSGKTAQVKFSVNGTEITTITPMKNSGATGNPPYTITVTDSDWYEVALPSGATDIKVETLDPANGRAIFIGLKAITE